MSPTIEAYITTRVEYYRGKLIKVIPDYLKLGKEDAARSAKKISEDMARVHAQYRRFDSLRAGIALYCTRTHGHYICTAEIVMATMLPNVSVIRRVQHHQKDMEPPVSWKDSIFKFVEPSTWTLAKNVPCHQCDSPKHDVTALSYIFDEAKDI
jgi:hypothetical protein